VGFEAPDGSASAIADSILGNALQLKNRAAGYLQRFKALIEQRAFLIQLKNPAAQPAQIADDVRVVLQDMRNRLQRIA